MKPENFEAVKKLKPKNNDYIEINVFFGIYLNFHKNSPDLSYELKSYNAIFQKALIRLIAIQNLTAMITDKTEYTDMISNSINTILNIDEQVCALIENSQNKDIKNQDQYASNQYVSSLQELKSLERNLCFQYSELQQKESVNSLEKNILSKINDISPDTQTLIFNLQYENMSSLGLQNASFIDPFVQSIGFPDKMLNTVFYLQNQASIPITINTNISKEKAETQLELISTLYNEMKHSSRNNDEILLAESSLYLLCFYAFATEDYDRERDNLAIAFGQLVMQYLTKHPKDSNRHEINRLNYKLTFIKAQLENNDDAIISKLIDVLSSEESKNQYSSIEKYRNSNRQFVLTKLTKEDDNTSSKHGIVQALQKIDDQITENTKKIEALKNEQEKSNASEELHLDRFRLLDISEAICYLEQENTKSTSAYTSRLNAIAKLTNQLFSNQEQNTNSSTMQILSCLDSQNSEEKTKNIELLNAIVTLQLYLANAKFDEQNDTRNTDNICINHTISAILTSLSACINDSESNKSRQTALLYSAELCVFLIFVQNNEKPNSEEYHQLENDIEYIVRHLNNFDNNCLSNNKIEIEERINRINNAFTKFSEINFFIKLWHDIVNFITGLDDSKEHNKVYSRTKTAISETKTFFGNISKNIYDADMILVDILP